MTSQQATHSASLVIGAAPDRIYDAFVSEEALARWLPPEGAVGRISAFEPVVGGPLRVVLTFSTAPGKSGANEDVVDAKFLELVPAKRVALAVKFVSDDPEFAGTMTMTWSLEQAADGTLVTCSAQDVPRGISQADHEKGMTSSLENLARYLAGDHEG